MLLAVFKGISQYQMHLTDPKYLYSFAIVCQSRDGFQCINICRFLLPDVFPVPHYTLIDIWDHQSEDDLNISRRFHSISVFQDGRQFKSGPDRHGREAHENILAEFLMMFMRQRSSSCCTSNRKRERLIPGQGSFQRQVSIM